MNTLEKLNHIVSYIEDNLDKEIDIDFLARKMGMSTFDVTRMFSFVSEMSVAEYIRKRRLTLAGMFFLENGEYYLQYLTPSVGYTFRTADNPFRSRRKSYCKYDFSYPNE